jgi:hypothetical protein
VKRKKVDNRVRRSIAGVVLAVIMVCSIFIAFFTPASALSYDAEKITLTGPGGTPDSTMTYNRGDTVYYRVHWKPTSENVTLNHTYDQFADGTTHDYITTDTAWAQGAMYEEFPTWVIPLNWPSDHFANNFIIEGRDSAGSNFTATIPFTSYIRCNIKAVATKYPDCFEKDGTLITFDGSGSSGSSTNLSYNWTFTGGFSGDNDGGKITKVWVNGPVTATLTVTDKNDLNCTDSTEKSVGPCPDEVPMFTPLGMVGLVTVLTALALLSIKTRKRR